MISIIICSKSPILLEKVTSSVAGTIGLAYEIIAIDNKFGKYGICEAYNIGAKRSKFEILCFMHEDILFHTQDWGKIVAEILSDKTIGLLGVTGSKYLPKAPGPWWGGGIEFCRRNILERYEDQTQERILQNPEQEKLVNVVAVDGLWFCARKEVWQEFNFDEKTFPYFHFYDLDFSAQVFQKYRVVVSYDILIEHFSRGNFNKAWITSALAFVNKWQRHLPLSIVPLTPEENSRIEARAQQAFVSRLLSIGYDKSITFHHVIKNLANNCFDKDNLWLLKQFIKGLASSRPQANN